MTVVAKNICIVLVALLLVWLSILISCRKELSCETCGGKKNDKPPIAIAKPDTTITLPVDSILLDGSSSYDPDGTITLFQWTKISGPAAIVSNSSAKKTIIKNLVAGTYQFELTVTDNDNSFAKDTVRVTVDAIPNTNHAPVANAGPDQTIVLPMNTATLDGSASYDVDNNISSYLWTQISGPSPISILNANAVQTHINNLTQGIYQFELKVTDAGGLFNRDTIQVTVNTQPPILPTCDTSNRPTVTAQLIPVGTLSLVRKDITVASSGNKILFAGGYLGAQSFSRVDIFDISSNSWSTAELSLGRAWIGAVAAGNKIFFAGGIIGGDSYDVVDIYDVPTNTWSVSHLSQPADNLAAATAGNKVFFAGGNWGVGATNNVDIYDFVSNTWTTASLSVPRNFITPASANNKVFFAGGYLANGQPSTVIDVFDNITGSWSTTLLQFSRANQAGIAVNDMVYFAGGITSSVTGFSYPTCTVETLEANTGATSLMNLFSSFSWFVDAGRNAVVKDNKIVFLHDGLDKFDIYDTQNNTWSIGVLSQPIPAGASFVSANNTIYVAGGLVNGVLTNQVWKLDF